MPELPETLIAYESTPNGVGNFFHREYISAKRGENGFKPIFVAWFEIDIYSLEIKNYKDFIESLSDEEKSLFKQGATLEAINWYRNKKRRYRDKWRFISEFPSNDVEAFQSSGSLVFSLEDIERMRKITRKPEFVGEVVGKNVIDVFNGNKCLEGLRFAQQSNGNLKVWALPDSQPIINRYLVSVDFGKGLSEQADNSIICVIDRYYMLEGGVPEVVAEWSGHLDKYIVAWKAVQIAMFYYNALLVPEKNTLIPKATDDYGYVIDIIAEVYNNIYIADAPEEQVKRKIVSPKYGFFTGHQYSSLTVVCLSLLKIFLRQD